MGLFTSPTSFRLANAVAGNNDVGALSTRSFTDVAFGSVVRRANDHSSHPALGHLILLVFEAVMEVVCVSLPGYIVARQGMFDADKQKFVANLNVALFTPCLSMYGSCVIMDETDGDSFHKIGITIDRGETCRARGYPSHFHSSDHGLVFGVSCCWQSIRIHQTRIEFRYGYGSKFTDINGR
jgi:hypothetical protein